MTNAIFDRSNRALDPIPEAVPEEIRLSGENLFEQNQVCKGFFNKNPGASGVEQATERNTSPSVVVGEVSN